jgi:hypothetical protein
LSSAILYVAIVAIWACVLIPRWLRRDSSAESSASASASEDSAGSSDRSDSPDSSGEWAADDAPAAAAEPGLPRRANRGGAPDMRRGSPDERRGSSDERRGLPDERRGSPDERRGLPVWRREAPYGEHRPVLSARRRLLALLVLLGVASGALAYTRLAVWWVVVPPSAILLGYLVVLRAASKADAERRELGRRPSARSGAAAGSPGRARSGTSAASAPPVAHAVPRDSRAPLASSASSASLAPSVSSASRVGGPEAEVIDIADHGGDIYDQYADAKRRAVGD